jgi:hypothetical protein
MIAADRAISFASNGASGWHPGRLWSLLDMMRVFAQNYLKLGMEIQDIVIVLDQVAVLNLYREEGEPEPTLTAPEKEDLGKTLAVMSRMCGDLGLRISGDLIKAALHDRPQTKREYEQLIRALRAEIDDKLFLFVPSHVAPYYEFDKIISDAAKLAFPTAYNELREGGNAFACGLNTACVFHAMRAAEIGVRALGQTLGVSFPNHPIDLAEWHNILDQSESKITAMKNLRRSAQKDEELHFYSQAATQFRFFKDGWRVRVAHARATFNEAQAKEAIDHVRSFFETISARLKE